MKKIISFSLWGDNPKYTVGAIRNSELAKKIYPDWLCRFYCGTSVPKETIGILNNMDNTEIIDMGVDGNWSGMFWRFYPASEDDVSVMISRDCDSRLSEREKEAVNEWLLSDKGFHIMRDHPHHNTPILGGMWGVKNGVIKNMREMINDSIRGDFWQVDQIFLKERIYPLIKNNSLIHDSYLNFEKEKNEFPTKRIDNEFVGDVFDENDIRHLEYYKLIK